MTSTCPVCGAPEQSGLVCVSCIGRLATDLRGNAAVMGVAELVDNLNVARTKQARIGGGTGGKAKPRPQVAEDEEGSHKLAHERLPINLGAMEAARELEFTLGSWAMDVTGDAWWPAPAAVPAVSAAEALLANLHVIRAHAAVSELFDEITKVIDHARKIIDRPAELTYVGPCLTADTDEHGQQVLCSNDLYAQIGAEKVRCQVCTAEHDIADRRGFLLESATDNIVSVREASRYLGFFGGIPVNQKTIRTWLDRGHLTERPGPTGERHIRLGDLFVLLANKAEQKTRRSA